MTNTKITRRRALAAAGASLALSPALRALAADEKRLFKIGACDWSIRRRQQPAALEAAKEIGLDGVQVSFGQGGEEYDLRKPEVRRAYQETGKRLGVEIASLAMGILNQRPFASDPEAPRWVAECIEVMPKLDQKVVLLAFFGKGDIEDKPQAQREVVRRLKRLAPQAEKAGVVLGIESTLNADEHLRILDAVGSPAVQVYYDTANMHYAGYDIYREVRQIGRERICEIHTKERDCLLGQGPIDFPKFKAALDDIGWTGWLVIEGATVRGKSVEECYQENQEYLRSVFPTAG
jgi:sugar phosphate isomerase/epimerase